MKSAEINKQIQDGDVNGSFERALSAADLSLVMAACRAADPATLFAPPCALTQAVLLALAQQLATDMVHDTQLKCRCVPVCMMRQDSLEILEFWGANGVRFISNDTMTVAVAPSLFYAFLKLHFVDFL